MARTPTTRLQVSGEAWHSEKYNQAAIKGLPISAETTGSKMGMFLGGGLGLSALAVGVAFLISFLSPSPDQGRAPIMTTQDGGLYVEYNGKVHPVTNLASARLITGTADKASVIDEKAIASAPRGSLMGIPSAPSSLSVRPDRDSSWGVCDWRDTRAQLSLTGGQATQTTIVSGVDAWHGGTPLDASGEAIIARSSSDSSQLWILFGTHKAQIAANDYAVHSALGITQDMVTGATVLSDGMLSAIPQLPELTVPTLVGVGSPSREVPRYNVGDVIRVPDAADAPVFYAVTDTGVQRVTKVVADLLVGDGGASTTADSSEIATLAQSNEITLTDYPSRAPVIVQPSTTCYAWTRPVSGNTAAPHIVYGDALPVTRERADHAVDLIQGPRGSSATAQRYVSRPGGGWFVQITGDEQTSDMKGQLAYVTDEGTRYDILPDDNGSYEQTLAALGFTGQPLPIPDAIARMLPVGSDLSIRNALVEHVQIPVDLNDGNAGRAPTSTAQPPAAGAAMSGP